jgi:hypothetical protein
MGSYSGTVPSFLAGELPDATKLKEVTDFMTAATAAWTTFTPTLVSSSGSPTIGNGTLTGRYKRLGKDVLVEIVLTRGSTTSFGTGFISFGNLPVTARTTVSAAGSATLFDSGTNSFVGSCHLETTTSIAPLSASGVITSTVPFTWATSDIIRLSMTYEAA